MKIVLLSSLFPLFLIGMQEEHSANRFYASNSPNHFLINVKQLLAEMGNTYYPEPEDNNAPLDKECISNTYWKLISSLPDQTSKDEALQKIIALNFTDEGYPLWRYHIAAAISVAKANPNAMKTWDNETCLGQATFKQDYSLCKLLLEYSAHTNINYAREPLLFAVKNRAVAELLIKYGANTNVINNNCVDYNLLMGAMHQGCKADLIPLYRSLGISPLHQNRLNATALHVFAFDIHMHSKKDILEKISALFKGLTHDEIIQLIHMRHSNRGTAFDILNDTIACLGIYSDTAHLLKSYLQSCLSMGQFDRQDLDLNQKL